MWSLRRRALLLFSSVFLVAGALAAVSAFVGKNSARVIVPQARVPSNKSNTPAGASDWRMIGHDAGNTQATPTTIAPPLALQWVFQPTSFPGINLPVAARGKLYLVYFPLLGTTRAVDFQQHVACLNMQTGKPEWDQAFNTLRRTTRSMPLVFGNLLLVVADRNIVVRIDTPSKPVDTADVIAFNTATHEKVWSIPGNYINDESVQTPRSVGPWVLIGQNIDGPVRCYQGRTGQVLGETSDGLTGGPFAANDELLFFPTGGEGYPDQDPLQLKAYRLPGLQPVWKKVGFYCPLVATKNRVFAGKPPRGVACLDTQGNILWTRADIALDDSYLSGMALGKDRLLVNQVKRSPQGNIIAVDTPAGRRAQQSTIALDAATGRTLWRAAQAGLPAVAGDVLYVRNLDGLFALSVRTGKVLWHARKIGPYDLAEDVLNHQRPILANGMVILSSHEWILALAPAVKKEASEGTAR